MDTVVLTFAQIEDLLGFAPLFVDFAAHRASRIGPILAFRHEERPARSLGAALADSIASTRPPIAPTIGANMIE